MVPSSARTSSARGAGRFVTTTRWWAQPCAVRNGTTRRQAKYLNVWLTDTCDTGDVLGLSSLEGKGAKASGRSHCTFKGTLRERIG